MTDIVDAMTKIRVVVHLGFDDESDKALQVAWDVAQKLLDEGVWVELIPDHVILPDLLGNEWAELPKIEINGWIAVIGRAPDPDELYTLIMSAVAELRHGGTKLRHAVMST